MRNGKTHRVHIRVHNEAPEEVEFVLEPWGEVYHMPANATYEISAEGPSADTLELVFGPGRITVYGWPGATATLTRDGEELTCDSPEAVQADPTEASPTRPR